MSLEKSILSGYEHRKPYYHSGRFDVTCRPNGSCSYCHNNRLHKYRKYDETYKEFIIMWNEYTLSDREPYSYENNDYEKIEYNGLNSF